MIAVTVARIAIAACGEFDTQKLSFAPSGTLCRSGKRVYMSNIATSIPRVGAQ